MSNNQNDNVFAEIQFSDEPSNLYRYDLFKTKLGVTTTDMWYDICCHTSNDFALADSINLWAKSANVGDIYSIKGVQIKIVA